MTTEAKPQYHLQEILPSVEIQRDSPVPGKTTIYFDRGAGAALRKLTVPTRLFTAALEEFADSGAEPAAS